MINYIESEGNSIPLTYDDKRCYFPAYRMETKPFINRFKEEELLEAKVKTRLLGEILSVELGFVVVIHPFH